MTRKVKESGVKARFFCEACGAEVKGGAPSCPSCGRPFAAVRCPECGFAGKVEDFKAGCPVCGKGAPLPSAATPAAGSRRADAHQHDAPGLPAWFYPLVTVALAALAVALLVLLLLS